MILSKAINRMRSSLLTAGLLTLATAASAQGYTYKSVPNDPMQTRIYTLKNGLTVYLSVNNEKPRIQTYIAVRTGSRNDPPETTGLAHYLEHLMFKGTTHFGTSNLEAERPYLDSIEARYEYYRTLTDPAQRKACYHAIDSLSQLAAQYNIPNEYDKMMASIGAEGTNAYTSNDVTCYVENIPSNEIDNWLKVESDRFQNMDDVNIGSVKKKIQAILGDGFRVQDRYEQQVDTFRIMEIEKLISYLFLTFILMIACFNVIGSLSMLIIDKRADVVTLRNLGANDKLITRIFLLEGRMISFFGAIIGVGLGLVLCFIQQEFGLIALGGGSGAAGNFVVDAYPVSVHAWDIVLVFLTVLVVGFLSVWYPVRYLSRRLL